MRWVQFEILLGVAGRYLGFQLGISDYARAYTLNLVAGRWRRGWVLADAQNGWSPRRAWS
jgi:hypothetical protein